jgi:hypothetical protein
MYKADSDFSCTDMVALDNRPKKALPRPADAYENPVDPFSSTLSFSFIMSRVRRQRIT